MTVRSALAAQTPAQPLLPMAHLTRLTTFVTWAAAAKFDLNSTCPTQGRSATYFFYGAPFYKLPHKVPHELDIDEVDELAVGILIPADQLDAIAADVYPFDTGAYQHGRYMPHLGPGTSALSDFVTTTVSAGADAAKLVNLLYGTNHAYITGFYGRPVPASTSPHVEQVRAMHKARMGADVRRRTIEVIALGQVSWPQQGIVVIGPRTELARRSKRVPVLDQLLKHPGTTVLPYEEFVPFSPREDSRAVLDLGIKWLRQQGYLPDEAS